MTPADADAFIRAAATLTWLAISIFLLAMALDRRGRDD